MSRAVRWLGLVGILASTGGCYRRAAHPPVTAILSRTALGKVVDSVATDPKFRTAHWGMLIVDALSGDTLYSRNAGKLFMPASNQKLLTGSTALAQLGPDFRFTTRFATLGELRNGVLEGDLIVVGRGDPSFSNAMRGDYRNAFRDMADSLAARGVRQINGALRRGGNAFPDSSFGYGWEIDDLTESYGAVVDELFVNEGFLPVRSKNAKGDSVTTEVSIREPATEFLDALRSALAEKQIGVIGASYAHTFVPDSGLRTLFAFSSPPLRDILPVMEKPSQNQIAELLFKTLALEKTGVGSADSAVRVIERQLLAWGAEKDGFAVRDGSGLSRHDYVTPATILKVLDAMRRHKDFKVFYDALPIAGVDGTIASRMKGTAAERNVHAKTGTVDKARSLSGYVTSANGRLLMFSFLCNNFTVPNREIERATDTILARIASSSILPR